MFVLSLSGFRNIHVVTLHIFTFLYLVLVGFIIFVCHITSLHVFVLSLSGFRHVHVVTLIPWNDVHCDFRVKTCSIRLDAHLICREFMFYLCYLYLSTYASVQHDFYIRWCSCRSTVTQRVSLVEHELLALPEHLVSFSVFSRVRVDRSLVLWYIHAFLINDSNFVY